MKIEERFKKVYADCHRAYEEGMEVRELDYRSTHAISGKQWLRLVKKYIPNGYNYFDQDVAQTIVDNFSPKAEFYPAREGSVAVYIKPTLKDKNPQLLLILGRIADESHYDKESNTIRLWWD